MLLTFFVPYLLGIFFGKVKSSILSKVKKVTRELVVYAKSRKGEGNGMGIEGYTLPPSNSKASSCIRTMIWGVFVH
jgi:hypothetical protein